MFQCSVEKNLDTFSFGGIFKNIGYLLQCDVNVVQHLRDHRLCRASIEKLQRSLSNKFLFSKALLHFNTENCLVGSLNAKSIFQYKLHNTNTKQFVLFLVYNT